MTGGDQEVTYTSECLVVSDGQVYVEVFRLLTNERGSETVNSGALISAKPEIGVHGLAIVREIVDSVRGRSYDPEIEARPSHAPPEIGVASR